MAKKKQVSLHITPEIYKSAQEKAKSQGLTTNVYIEQLVRKDLGK
ncbi:hypothetical protein V7054_05085 [Priestia megaterium]|nr:hypothetical protein [Priestia aryabhattai]